VISDVFVYGDVHPSACHVGMWLRKFFTIRRKLSMRRGGAKSEDFWLLEKISDSSLFKVFLSKYKQSLHLLSRI